MNRISGSFLTAVFMVVSMPAAGQWLNVPTKGIPRTKDGKPDLSAPAPRKPDGKPDLSGIWMTEDGKYTLDLAADFSPDELLYVRRGQGLSAQPDLPADFKPGDLPIQPWAEALTRERITGAHGDDYPSVRCLPQGVPILDTGAGGSPLKIVQEPDVVVILYERFSQFRQIFLDGRTLPKDPNPTWLGYSVGRWESGMLVVDSTGFNGKTWLDLAGHPSTDALHITERFRRRDFGHLDLTLTIDDPNAYTKPWTVTETMKIFPDTELLEFVCNENEKDLKHLVSCPGDSVSADATSGIGVGPAERLG